MNDKKDLISGKGTPDGRNSYEKAWAGMNLAFTGRWKKDINPVWIVLSEHMEGEKRLGQRGSHGL